MESVRILPGLDGNIIEIRSDRPITFVTYTLQNPDRIILDPVEPDVTTILPSVNRHADGLITVWRIFRKGGEGGKVDYLSFELTKPAEHLVEQLSGLLVIKLRSKEGAALKTIPLPPPSAGSPPRDEPSPGFSGDGVKPWSLDALFQFGLSRRRVVRVSNEDLQLAQMKVREARRAIYPAANLKASWTGGTASNINFREANFGIEVQQPLYYSGRLMETYRQSLVNLQVAEKKQSKVKSDISLEIAQAYFQLIGAKRTLAAQAGLESETREFLKKTQARFDQGLLTRLELLNVESQVNQAKFQKLTGESDLELARLKFIQRLGLLEPKAMAEAPEQFPDLVMRDVDLKETLSLALRYRPDIQINALLVEFYEFEERISKQKNEWKIDLTGSLGMSGSAFETEPLNMAEDYAVGARASRSFGPHGGSASVNKTKTSPRLGQTSRTDSTVYSGEFGILSQLQGLSAVQEALLSLEKAKNDLQETKASVLQEVEEAHVGYLKARLQLEYAQQKIAFREEQVKILQAQASLNEALPSQVLEAMMRLSDERVNEVQALANYYVSLAKLNKAIGLPGHYQ